MQTCIIIIPLNELLRSREPLLSEKSLIGGLFEPESINEFVVFLEIGISPEVEDDFIDMVCARRSEVPLWLMAEHKDLNTP